MKAGTRPLREDVFGRVTWWQMKSRLLLKARELIDWISVNREPGAKENKVTLLLQLLCLLLSDKNKKGRNRPIKTTEGLIMRNQRHQRPCGEGWILKSVSGSV